MVSQRLKIFSDPTDLRRKQYEKQKRKRAVEPKMADIRKWSYHMSDKAPICNLFDEIPSE